MLQPAMLCPTLSTLLFLSALGHPPSDHPHCDMAREKRAFLSFTRPRKRGRGGGVGLRQAWNLLTERGGKGILLQPEQNDIRQFVWIWDNLTTSPNYLSSVLEIGMQVRDKSSFDLEFLMDAFAAAVFSPSVSRCNLLKTL